MHFKYTSVSILKVYFKYKKSILFKVFITYLKYTLNVLNFYKGSEGCSEPSKASFCPASENFQSYNESAEPIGTEEAATSMLNKLL